MRRDEGDFSTLTPYEAPAGSASDPVEASTFELRPRGVGETLDLALEVYRSRFGVLVGTATLLWLPIRFAQPFIGAHNWQRAGADLPLGALFGSFFTLLATLVVAVLVNAFVALHVAADLRGGSLRMRDALRQIVSRSGTVLVLAVLSGILTGVGTVCFCLPGIFLMWKLYVAPVVCVVEGVGVQPSMSRSFDLCTGRLLPWVGLVLVAFTLTIPLTTISNVVDDPNLRARTLELLGVPAIVFDWAGAAFTSLFSGVASAFHGVVVAVWYFDCRARREGVDLSARLECLQGASGIPAGVAP